MLRTRKDEADSLHVPQLEVLHTLERTTPWKLTHPGIASAAENEPPFGLHGPLIGSATQSAHITNASHATNFTALQTRVVTIQPLRPAGVACQAKDRSPGPKSLMEDKSFTCVGWEVVTFTKAHRTEEEEPLGFDEVLVVELARLCLV